MSIWHSIKSGDIDVNYNDEEVEIFVWHDSNGSIYATLTFNQIKEIYNKI